MTAYLVIHRLLGPGLSIEYHDLSSMFPDKFLIKIVLLYSKLTLLYVFYAWLKVFRNFPEPSFFLGPDPSVFIVSVAPRSGFPFFLVFNFYPCLCTLSNLYEFVEPVYFNVKGILQILSYFHETYDSDHGCIILYTCDLLN